MRKFTSTTNTVLKEKRQPLLNKALNNLIAEHISIKGEDTLEGKDKLIQDFQAFLTQEKESTKTRVLENVKFKSFQNLNFFDINNRIDTLSESVEQLEIIPSVEDIFAAEDFTKTNENFTFGKLTQIPAESFGDYLNENAVVSYFEDGHQVIIKEDKGWDIFFEPNLNKYFGSNDEKWNFFKLENNNFIADFIKSASELIGVKNLRIDSRISA